MSVVQSGKQIVQSLSKAGTITFACQFKSILGNMDATDEECQRAKQIMQDAGSIDYALDLAKKKVENAISMISFLPDGEDKEFMIALARYAIDRDVRFGHPRSRSP